MDIYCDFELFSHLVLVFFLLALSMHKLIGLMHQSRSCNPGCCQKIEVQIYFKE